MARLGGIADEPVAFSPSAVRRPARLPGSTRSPFSSLSGRRRSGFDSSSNAKQEDVARLGGIEPPLPAPEAGALSPELQAPFEIIRRPVPSGAIPPAGRRHLRDGVSDGARTHNTQGHSLVLCH